MPAFFIFNKIMSNKKQANRLKQSERVDIIIDHLNGKSREGFKVIEGKDKEGNDRYMVRRIKPNQSEREIIEKKIAKLQKKLDLIKNGDKNENDENVDLSSSNSDN